MTGNIIKIEDYLTSRKKRNFKPRDRQALEWIILSTLQLEENQAYNMLLESINIAGLNTEFNEILDRIYITKEGYYLIKEYVQ